MKPVSYLGSLIILESLSALWLLSLRFLVWWPFFLFVVPVQVVLMY